MWYLALTLKYSCPFSHRVIVESRGAIFFKDFCDAACVLVIIKKALRTRILSYAILSAFSVKLPSSFRLSLHLSLRSR
ncbi:hypothetical protein D3C77_197180 [compost metagenome]